MPLCNHRNVIHGQRKVPAQAFIANARFITWDFTAQLRLPQKSGDIPE
jgi:hypothetical protein